MTKAMRSALAVLLYLAGSLVHAQPGQGMLPTTSVYTCIDDRGRRLTSDRPIPECIDREQRVLGKSGTEVKRLGPTLTENERTVLEAQRRKEAEDKAQIAEERRKERALVARFPHKEAHDAERNAALDQVDDLTKIAQKRIAELQEQRAKFDTEMEFYKKAPHQAPMHLRRAIAENEDHIAEQLRFIAGQAQEKRRVHQRFDTELAYLRKLWAERSKPLEQQK